MFCHPDYLYQLRDEVLKIVGKLYLKKKLKMDIYSISSCIFSPLIFSWHFTIKIKKESLEFYNYLTLG